MKKNDKLIVIFGVLILIIASIGVYYSTSEVTIISKAEIDEFFKVTGETCNIPDSITVSDECPFYALIATPVAVNYDGEGNQDIIPLFIEKIGNPSKAVWRVKNEQLNLGINELIIEGGSAKDVSLEVAKNFWDSSKAALIIEYNQSGYELGVIATPLASYLRIPVIITDKIDINVSTVLNDLGVEKTFVCGENLEGFGKVLNFKTVEEIVDNTTKLLLDKFGDIDYITLTNPIDAFPPKVLDSETWSFGPETIGSLSMSQLGNTLKGAISGKISTTWSFTIPEDYKYALIKFEGVNHNIDDVDVYGDQITFGIGPKLDDIPGGLANFEVFAGGTGAGGIAERDTNGKIISDSVYNEAVVYDRGGVEYEIDVSGTWTNSKEGSVSGHIVVEKLENPVYPLMQDLSSIAPYLTAYHKGIVFGKPDFAFTANDDIITEKGETCPGFYVPRRNPDLVPLSNKHIFDNILYPLNDILANLADIELVDDRDLKTLTNYYKENPVYIALVGGNTVLPNYIYQNHIEPAGDIDGDGTDDTPYYVGGGTPSDVIYGNIDPIRYDWSNQANDMFSDSPEKYPFIENFVGRITGFDPQDASALIARTIFYDDIIENLENWKNTFGILMGGGSDFQKPTIRYIIFGDILQITSRGEPMKYDTGYTEISGERTIEQIAKPAEFNVYQAWYEAAMREGLSDEAIKDIHKSNLLNKLMFREGQVRRLVGEGVVYGGDVMESSNYIFTSCHGNQHLFGMAGNRIIAAGLGGPIMYKLLYRYLPILGGFTGPGGDLSNIGNYNTRAVADMEFGPSFMWLESCICGKIDGVYPKVSVGQTLLHAGVNSLIASPTGTNIAGGYLEPKSRMYDNPISVAKSYIKAKLNAKKGIYPDPHFGFLIYTDLCKDLRENDVSVGEALRNAKNNYLPQDDDWVLWWAPPLISSDLMISNNDLYKTTSSDSTLSPMMEAKYTSFQEFMLFGDPAFNPYEPVNEGK